MGVGGKWLIITFFFFISEGENCFVGGERRCSEKKDQHQLNQILFEML